MIVFSLVIHEDDGELAVDLYSSEQLAEEAFMNYFYAKTENPYDDRPSEYSKELIMAWLREDDDFINWLISEQHIRNTVGRQ